jgi:hypothetical protein
MENLNNKFNKLIQEMEMGRDNMKLTSLPLQHALCRGVSHFASLVLTLAPFSISASAIQASPLKAAACNGLRFSLS